MFHQRQADIPGQHLYPHTVTRVYPVVPAQPELATVEAEQGQMPRLVQIRDVAFQQNSGITLQPEGVVGARQGFPQWPLCHHPARFHHHDVIRQPGNLRGGMRDVDDRNRQGVAQPLEVRKDVLFAGKVQGRQRLVHQQQLRAGQQGPGNRDALAFTAGKARGHSGQVSLKTKPAHGMVEPDLPLAGGDAPVAELQVLANVQVGEQVGFLEHEGQRPLVHGADDIVSLPGFTEHGHGARGTLQARHAPEQGGLAAARMPEQGGDAGGRQGQVNIQVESRKGTLEARPDGIGRSHPRALERALPFSA